ncbi:MULTISPECIES: DUF6352 family protein [Acidovorax]|uniref:Uncharacterized protein n=1 Tax=Acidovorax soli TaxID=592050 RepID=A0A1H3VLM9_9BURK|nr:MULTISPECIES: DUF6352 family protein [Acidovorax]SDZ75685.1 hypothetical protein SAMN05421875_101248 [Acidovorax soli]
MNSSTDFWPPCGFHALVRNARGWLVPTETYFQWILARPELALVPESCAAEMALHQSLATSPLRPVAPQELAVLADDDARENYAVFLHFRDALVSAGTLEAYYLQLMRGGAINIPAVFIDAMVQAMLRNLLNDCNDAVEARAAEMLFRSQRVSLQDGQMLAGDRATLDMLNETAGLGDVGRLLLESGALQPHVELQVLGADNAAAYWQDSGRYRFLLDLTHELTQDLSHGLTFKMTRARSGLKALARVLERWVQHFLGVQVRVEPVHQVTDSAWRWHVGLDVESTAILNDLYQGHPVEADRMARLVSLFTLTFANPAEMRADVAGKPVYLGLATNAEGVVRIKPQNLLLNLPLASSS